MSIMVMEILPVGIIFAADRNVTGYDNYGNTIQDKKIEKVLKWPNRKAVIGFVGAANINNMYMDEWLKLFIKEYEDFNSFEVLAKELCCRIEKQRRIDEGSNSPVPLIIHLGGFERRNGFEVPVIWFIRNVYGMGKFDYRDFRKEFQYSEEFWNMFPKAYGEVFPEEIRKILSVLAKKFQPYWFHHGIDLATFNVMQDMLKSTFKLLCENLPNHEFPRDLSDWEKYLKMQVLMYGAYFEAFFPENKHFVGGGVDIASIPWPE